MEIVVNVLVFDVMSCVCPATGQPTFMAKTLLLDIICRLFY